MNRAERRRQAKEILVVSPNPAGSVEGNYFPALLATGAQSEPGTVRHVRITHDDWCDLLNSRGSCNCNPEVQMSEAKGGV